MTKGGNGFSDNKVFDNKVLSNRLSDILETKLDTINLMTVDRELEQEAGMKRAINTYTYEGAVEAVAEGQANTKKGKVTFTEAEYEVKVKQQEFEYTDEQYMKDPMILEVGLKGSAIEMVNDMNNDYFTEIAKTSTVMQHEGPLTYDVVVDAIAKMNIEDETGLFLLIGNDAKAEIRKDADFKASRLGEILYTGQIGDICGVPVIVSKKVPTKTKYLATKEAVTLFIKKKGEVETDRVSNKRLNSVIPRTVCVVALTDATKAVKITDSSLLSLSLEEEAERLDAEAKAMAKAAKEAKAKLAKETKAKEEAAE